MKLTAINRIFLLSDAADSGDDELVAAAAAFRGRSSSSSIEKRPSLYYYAPVDPGQRCAITVAIPLVEAVMLRIVPALVLAVMLGACGQKPADDATAAAGAANGTATADAPPPAPVEPPTVPPPPPAHPLEVGSQAAKDDLYCSAVIYAANPQPPNALNPIDEALLQKARTLGFIIGEEGINMLVTEKAAHATHAAVIADAYADQVDKDMKAKKLRISLDECNKRAAALPVPQ